MTDRTKLAPRALGTALLSTLALAAPAAAVPATVDLRVEGKTKTIYENAVTTDGHNVTTPSGGTHKCDGTNGGVNPTPGPSATAALDDGARSGGFTFDGSYSDGFDDFLISRVGSDSQDVDGGLFWGLLVNSEFSSVGGCQQRVRQGDEVLWALSGFVNHALRLNGPVSATTNRPFTVRVTDGATGASLGGATVGGAKTGADGRADLVLKTRGSYRLKAERSDSIRSNALVVCVDPPGATPCSSFDHTPPRAAIDVPGPIVSDESRSRRFPYSWSATDAAGGSGVLAYSVEFRKTSTGVGKHSTSDWLSIVRETNQTNALFRGRAGAAYDLRVVAIDRARNASKAAVDSVVIPVDDRDKRYLKRSKSWRRLKRKDAFRGRVLRTRKEGATLRLRWRGTAVALIGRELKRGGKLKVTIDGDSRVIDLRGKSDFREVLFTSKTRERGRHRLKLVALGGGPVEIDAIAPLP